MSNAVAEYILFLKVIVYNIQKTTGVLLKNNVENASLMVNFFALVWSDTSVEQTKRFI